MRLDIRQASSWNMSGGSRSVCVCVSVCQFHRVGVETSVLPNGLLSRVIPAHFLNTCHIVTGLHEGEMSQQMTRAEFFTAGTRELLAKRLQHY